MVSFKPQGYRVIDIFLSFKNPHLQNKTKKVCVCVGGGGGRAFRSFAAQIRKSLPFALRHSSSLPAFKTRLKPYFFKEHFDQ